MKCPKSEGKSRNWPGTVDQCEHCGRDVRTRRDGTYAKHNEPTETYWKNREEEWS